jgi:hypothetical protein
VRDPLTRVLPHSPDNGLRDLTGLLGELHDPQQVTGGGFGATQGSSYLTFSDDGTNWGAPPDEASFTIDSWSDSAITFTVPQPSAPTDSGP